MHGHTEGDSCTGVHHVFKGNFVTEQPRWLPERSTTATLFFTLTYRMHWRSTLHTQSSLTSLTCSVRRADFSGADSASHPALHSLSQTDHGPTCLAHPPACPPSACPNKKQRPCVIPLPDLHTVVKQSCSIPRKDSSQSSKRNVILSYRRERDSSAYGPLQGQMNMRQWGTCAAMVLYRRGAGRRHCLPG